MGQPKTGKGNNLNAAFGNTGANIVKAQIGTGKQEIMHKTTGDSQPTPNRGLAKAAPTFKDIKPDEKVVGSEDAQKKAIEDNLIKGSDDTNDNDDQG